MITFQPKLSEGVIALLRAVARGAPRDATLELREHGGRQHTRVNQLPSLLVGDRLIPELVLKTIEKSPSPWTLQAAVCHGGAPLSCSVLVVRREFPQIYANAQKPGSPYGQQWFFPVSEFVGWYRALLDGSLPPTAIVRSLPSAFAVWSLDEPVTPALALDLSAAIASRVGAEPAAEFALPGTSVLNLQPRVTSTEVLDASRLYDVPIIHAALRGMKEVPNVQAS